MDAEKATAIRGQKPDGASVPSVAPQPPVYDRLLLTRFLEGDSALASEIILAFVAGIPPQIESLKGSLSRGETQQVILNAHTLKGTAASTGCMALAAAAAELERAGQEDHLADLSALVPALERQAALLRTEVLAAHGGDGSAEGGKEEVTP